MNDAVRGKRLSQPSWKPNRDGPKRTCPGAASAVGTVGVGVSDGDVSCDCRSRMRPPHQFPFSQWERPSVGLRRQQALPAHWLPSGKGSGRPSNGTLPWALWPVPQLPRPTFVTRFQVALS